MTLLTSNLRLLATAVSNPSLFLSSARLELSIGAAILLRIREYALLFPKKCRAVSCCSRTLIVRQFMVFYQTVGNAPTPDVSESTLLARQSSIRKRGEAVNCLAGFWSIGSEWRFWACGLCSQSAQVKSKNRYLSLLRTRINLAFFPTPAVSRIGYKRVALVTRQVRAVGTELL
jgi:hypothetical protein